MQKDLKSELPLETRRVLEIVEYYCNGNELQFSREIGVSQPRINRLFTKDSRNDKYPQVSFDIIKAILENFKEVSSDWLVLGGGNMFREDNFNQTGIDLTIPLSDYQHIYNSNEIGDMVTGNSLISKLKNLGVEFLIEKKNAIYGCKEISVDSFIIYGREYFLYTELGILIKRLYPIEGHEDELKCVGEYDEIPFKIDRKSIKKLAIVLSKLENY